ncbi:general secretion pathway protein GspB [Vibrio alginolyticus]
MSVVKHTSLLLLPVGVSVLAAAYYLEMQNAQTDTETKGNTAASIQQFQVLDYPENKKLTQLTREWPTAEHSGGTEANLPAVEYASSTNNPPSSRVNDEELGLSLGDIDLSSLSPGLAMKVENALSGKDKSGLQHPTSLNDLEGNTQRWRGRLPALNLQTHMYASDANRRWVKINNVEYHQGEVVDGQVTLKEIQPQAVIVEFEGEQIRIPALYEWQG